jgi:hypothetical protein
VIVLRSAPAGTIFTGQGRIWAVSWTSMGQRPRPR